jgi:hypothetical protein
MNRAMDAPAKQTLIESPRSPQSLRSPIVVRRFSPADHPKQSIGRPPGRSGHDSGRHDRKISDPNILGSNSRSPDILHRSARGGGALDESAIARKTGFSDDCSMKVTPALIAALVESLPALTFGSIGQPSIGVAAARNTGIDLVCMHNLLHLDLEDPIVDESKAERC